MTNLIPNHGFEEDWEGWSPDPYRPQDCVIDNTFAHRGVKSLRLERVTTGRTLAISDPITVDPNLNYLLHGFIFTKQLKSERYGAYVHIYFYNEAGVRFEKWYATNKIKGTTTRWIKVTTGVFKPPEGTAYIDIRPLIYESIGVAWFDSLLLMEGSIPFMLEFRAFIYSLCNSLV